MSGFAERRGFLALILVLWMTSGAVVAAHSHQGCDCGHCDADDDRTPCAICVAASFAPAIGVVKPTVVADERDVVAWIRPWIALVPQDAFFDRPLARGPPALS